MRITRINLKNFGMFDSVEVKPGKSGAVFEGPNDLGKTTFVRALVTSLGGRFDESVIKKGQPKSEVALDFDTGDTVQVIMDREKGKRFVRATDADGKPIAAASSFVSQLVDGLTVNPIQLLNAPAKQRVDWLIATLPVSVSAAEISKATGFNYKPTGEEKNGFDLLARLRKSFYDERTGLNGQVTSKTKAAEELRQTLPEADTAVGGDISSLRRQREELLGSREEEKRLAAEARSAAFRKIGAGSSAKIEELTNARVDEINAIQEKYRDLLDKVKSKARAYENEAQVAFEAAAQSADLTHGPALEKLAAQIAVAEKLEERAHVAAQTRKTVAAYEKDALELGKQAESFTQAIAGIDALKSDLIARVPIKGLEVKDGDIYIDGVAFDALNEARRIRLAFELAKLRAGELPVCCVDGIESLDEAHLKALEEWIPQSGMQVFMTRVATKDEEGKPIEKMRIRSVA